MEGFPAAFDHGFKIKRIKVAQFKELEHVLFLLPGTPHPLCFNCNFCAIMTRKEKPRLWGILVGAAGLPGVQM